MVDYRILTDSSADLPFEYLKEHDVITTSLLYSIEGQTYSNDGGLPVHDFYEKMRAGNVVTTSQVNPTVWQEAFEKALQDTDKLLVIAFSSGLSGTFNSARIAAEEVMDEKDNVEIVVIDSLAASMGEGLLVHKAVVMHEAGKSFEETAEWIEAHKHNLVHAFTVSDLMHLYRGGRVSKTSAIVGTVINIKPVLNVDDEGHLVNVQNYRGRKKALRGLVDYMESHMGAYKDENDIVFISHGDNEEDAKAVAEDITERFGITNFLFSYIGPTIGAHSGPDTVAIFFMGDAR